MFPNHFPPDCADPLSAEELWDIQRAIADAQFSWRKRRQHAEGAIDLGDVGDYTADECTQKIKDLRALESRIEWLALSYEEANR